MEIKEAVQKRRSIRAFHPTAVPKEVLERILERALWAPSWGNTQPWGLTIVSGRTLESIKEECLELSRLGIEDHPDLTMPFEWEQSQTARYKDLGKALFQALGIGRGDHEGRNKYYDEMTFCFSAPHMIYLHLNKGFNPYALLDAGLILQTVALLAVDQGLGTCFLARSVIYPEVIRNHARIGPNRIVVMGVAIGYPIHDHPANLFPRKRGEPGEFIQWVKA